MKIEFTHKDVFIYKYYNSKELFDVDHSDLFIDLHYSPVFKATICTRYPHNPRTAQIQKGTLVKMLAALKAYRNFNSLKFINYYHEGSDVEIMNQVNIEFQKQNI